MPGLAEFLRYFEFPSYYGHYGHCEYFTNREREPISPSNMVLSLPISEWPIVYHSVVEDVLVSFSEGEKFYRVIIKCLGPNSLRFKHPSDKIIYKALKDRCKLGDLNANVIFSTEDGQILEEVKK